MTEFGYNEPPKTGIIQFWYNFIIGCGIILIVLFGLMAWAVLSISEIGEKK